ncbi:MAG: 3-dehydroquinate synthase [Alistipes senegalensis]|nr:3-dehydroquinate synthase [Bacteroides cellulosilyticus]MCM1352785.1 3-dehydroquinate synthase [Alistipes senegalensis]
MEPSFVIGTRSPIYIGSVSEILPQVLPEGRVAAISDAAIDRLYHELLAPYGAVLVGKGESIKTLQTVEAVYRKFLETGIDRSTFVLGIGGGIVTDITGFAASTYMRGLRFGFIPTTLLGQVDAAIGGKNGVNVDGYKNMAGTFTQPEFVICDPALLATLPDREFRAGLAEIIKAAIIADAELFARLETVDFAQLRRDKDLLADVIRAAVRVKVEIVARDEREAGERRKLNLGHTLAHAIEKCSVRMNHGEAVAVGIRLIAEAAVKDGLLAAADCERIVALLKKSGFALETPVEVKRMLKEVAKDKKNKDGQLRIVFPTAIGDCTVRTLSPTAFAALLPAKEKVKG